MLENSQASHTYLLSQEFVCPRNCGWADWKQAQARAHVNSAPAGDCSAVALPRLLARRSFLVFPPFGIDWYWDSNPALVHECINLYDTSYAVGYFFPLNSRQIFLFYKALCNIFQHFPCLFYQGWPLSLPGCRSGTNFRHAQVNYVVSIMVWYCPPQASMARLP